MPATDEPGTKHSLSSASPPAFRRPRLDFVYANGPDRTRISLALVAALWISALAILFIGLRLKLRPVLLIGFLDLLLALGATVLAFRRHRRPFE